MFFPLRYRMTRPASLFALLLLALAAPAHAIDPKADVFFGYSRLGNDTFARGAGGLNGWEGALNVKVRRFVGIEGDVAHYGMGADSTVPHSTVVLFGPRLTAGGMGAHVFVHALVGDEHSSDSNGLSQSGMTVDFGGGGDVRVLPFFALRLSADYLNALTVSPGAAAHERVSAGAVFRF